MRIGGRVVIEPEGDTRCDVCNRLAETRPYGPGGKRVCFQCASSTPEMKALTRRNFERFLDGEPPLESLPTTHQERSRPMVDPTAEVPHTEETRALPPPVEETPAPKRIDDRAEQELVDELKGVFEKFGGSLRENNESERYSQYARSAADLVHVARTARELGAGDVQELALSRVRRLLTVELSLAAVEPDDEDDDELLEPEHS